MSWWMPFRGPTTPEVWAAVTASPALDGSRGWGEGQAGNGWGQERLGVLDCQALVPPPQLEWCLTADLGLR